MSILKHFDSRFLSNLDGATLVHPASMWTRKDIQEFKNQVRKEGADTIMKVGHGETVTVSFQLRIGIFSRPI